MRACITKVTGREAYDLLSEQGLISMEEVAKDSMIRALNNSDPCWIGDVEGKIIATWGLIAPTFLSDRAYLWLYTTRHFEGHQFMFIRHSQRVIHECLERFPIIIGHCMIDNHKAQRWLRWLGAEFGAPVEGKVLPFEIRAKQWPHHSELSA